MKRISIVVATMGILIIASTSPLSSQVISGTPLHFGLMGGAVKPVGNLSAYADHNWSAGALLSIGKDDAPLRFRFDGQWQQVKGRRYGGSLDCVICHGVIEGTDFRVLDATANVVYSVAVSAPTHLYFIGGLGVYNERATDISTDASVNRTRFGINGGAGVSFHFFHKSTFVEARYHDIVRGGSFGSYGNVYEGPNTFQFIPINVGVMF